MSKAKRWFAWICVAMLFVSTLPLYAISWYNHPYYDDFGLSAQVHQTWMNTGSLSAVLKAAVESAQETRETWQGTYTATLLTNLQPGLFNEDLYWIGNVFLLTAFIACLGFLFVTFGQTFGLQKWDQISLSALATTLMIQFMPDVGEAFFWYNGGVAYLLVYSLLALAAALVIRWLQSEKHGLFAPLLMLAVMIGGGTYGCGLFTLCVCAVLSVWLFVRRHVKRWWFAALACLFAACFVYNMSAPGNTARANMIGYQSSAVKAVIQSLYYGVGQIGGFIRLPLFAITLVLLPAIYQAAKRSDFRFAHPWLMMGGVVCLYCTQFTPPLYSIASIGGGRIINTYWISFVTGWFLAVYYLCGYAARRYDFSFELSAKSFWTVALTALCLFGMGSLGFKREGDVLYGIQNLSGPSAFLSIWNGEAAQYDREMSQREALLNDPTQSVVTLRPLTQTPAVLMDDLLKPDAVYDVRPSLCHYYGKEAIILAEEADE